MLINGRRTVQHPITQLENGVPTFTYNSNAIPVSGLKSLEVLRDGAAAIYGTDAVAGVINTVLQDDYRGMSLEGQYGYAQGTNMKEGRLTGLYGTDIGGGRGNWTLFGTVESRSALMASDRDYLDQVDRRPLFAGTEFENATVLDTRDIRSAWGVFRTPASYGTIRSNGVAVTGATGIFHIAPETNPTCGVSVGTGICLNSGAQNMATDRNLRFDPRTFDRTAIPSVDRYNLFSTFKYRLNDDIEFFSELGLYHARSRGTLSSVSVTLSTVTITIPASNYYNPFGATYLPDGQLNPNRLPGLNIPDAGVPVTIDSYGLVDAGQTDIKVKNTQYRLLGGLRGEALGFNWESALLYSRARSVDSYNALSATLFQQALARSTPDAYNPFNGGTVGNPSFGDATPSSAAALEGLRVPFTRAATTGLSLWDFKVNRPDLLAIWGGDVGVAAGVEVRRETFHDDRDARIDGTIPYIDPISGVVFGSDVPGASPSPDIRGRRTIASAFAELAVPLVSPEMNVPLVHKLEFQAAGRYEHYSDVGSIAKPKFAGAWDIMPGVRLRGSWSQGFRAPNLEQVNPVELQRNTALLDYVYCEADLQAGRISSFNACTHSRQTRIRRAGNPDLKPETSTSLSYGIALSSDFMPRRFGRLTLTVDAWKIKQKGIVGGFAATNALALDYLLRMQGSSNPAVLRQDPTPEQIATFAGTGLTPVGQVDYIDDKYLNLSPQTATGIDFGLVYDLGTDRLGDFSLNVDVALMDKLYLAPSSDVARLLAAKDAGLINGAVPISGGENLIGQNGNVKWRGSASFNWRYKGFGLTWHANYVGRFYDTGLTYAAGGFYSIEPTMQHNVALSYSVREDAASFLHGTRFMIGARNVFDREPPLAPTAGYAATVYNPFGRYLYMNVKKSF